MILIYLANCSLGLLLVLQMLMWGLSGPIFGAIADKYGGHKAIMLAFVFYILGIYFLYSGPNTGVFFQIHMGLIGWYRSWRYCHKYSNVNCW